MKRWWLLLCIPSAVFAERANWPQLYNQGVIAYRSNDFAEASRAFEQSLASPDRTLQQRAFYNLGNGAYRTGEVQPSRAQERWQQALKYYESALALDPNDADAKFNHDYVKQKLEDLKQPLQQNEQQNKEQATEQPKQQEPETGTQDQPQPSQDETNSQRQQEPPKQQPEQQQGKEQEQEQEHKQDQEKARQQQAQAQPEEQFDKQQARALLDNLREEERNWNFFPEAQMRDLKNAGEPAKDW